ncbi:MAG: O-linked N-acetylglucosamine transferase family protein [Planctomycetota bacterium]|jgi:hypothetical protein
MTLAPGSPSVPEQPSPELVVGWIETLLASGDIEQIEDCIPLLLGGNPNHWREAATAELATARRAHEAVDDGLRRGIFGSATSSHAWERTLLPDANGQLTRPQWLANAMWLRLCGSDRVGAGLEPVHPDAFRNLPFVEQAKALGRMLVVTDATTAIDYPGLAETVHPRLLPALTSWLLCVYLQSPEGIASPAVLEHQRRAIRDLEHYWDQREPRFLVAPRAFGACFRDAYADDRSQRRLAELVQGGFCGRLFAGERERAPAMPFDLEALPRGGAAVISSMWRESHVVHRCMGPMLEPLRERGAVAIVVEDRPPGARSPLPTAWANRCVTPELESGISPLAQYASLANRIADADLDLAVFPEVGLTNDSIWLATQRLARIQVTGYGHPITSGSRHMDYFIGGTDVEGENPDYTEQLVLVPGLGVSTTVPPRSSVLRRRPYDDDRIRVVSLASFHKLHAGLLASWESILADNPTAWLDLLPGLSVERAQRFAPVIGQHFRRGRVELHPRLPRAAIADLLVDADLYLDSFPFGGFNTLVEVLAAGCPVVTLEGSQARNRFGAAVLRRLGLPEWLIARDWRGYVAAARRLIGDAGLRTEIRARIGSRERVLSLLADPDAGLHMEAALQWIREQGPRVPGRSRAPRVVEAA